MHLFALPSFRSYWQTPGSFASEVSSGRAEAS